jgi:hypothetical protein
LGAGALRNGWENDMADAKTRSELISALQKSAKTKISAEELQAQRISFIMGTLKKDSGITREKVQRVLEEQKGKK